MSATTLPESQYAVQLVGPDKLELNTNKAVPKPAPHEILLKTEAVGLCFSDLKLLKQFDAHARKSDIVAGIDKQALAEMQAYVPNDKPVVPGHEVVAKIIEIGDQVKHHTVGERCLLQTDYRELKTAGSNAAFGYNFEGGLQEYVVVDERVVVDSKGERFLIPVSDEKSASAVALVEPWACVEDSYVNRERTRIKAGGRLLIVADADHDIPNLSNCYDPSGEPKETVVVPPEQVGGQPNEAFDDIIYFGSDKQVIETLSDKLGTAGIINIVLGGKKIGSPVTIGIGRVHYGFTRWIGTVGNDPAESYTIIPEIDEIRPNDRILVIGAGGPMGQMHVIRNVCSGIEGIELVGTDFDDPRIESIEKKARPFADANNVKMQIVNPKNQPLDGETFDYIAIMAPIPAVVAQSILDARPNAIINIFAGIPAPVKHEIDLDTYIERKVFMFGTSGSVIEDMKIVLGKVEQDILDTNTSLDAVSGMQGATDGIAAVENRTLAGKIIVYPSLRNVGLIPLVDMESHYPTVAQKMQNGQWTKAAEQEFLRVAAG